RDRSDQRQSQSSHVASAIPVPALLSSNPVSTVASLTERKAGMSNSGVLDTRFRSALDRMAEQGRLTVYAAPVDPHLEVAGIMKKLDGGPALLFTAVDGYDIPVVGNLLACQANCEAAFGTDFRAIRAFVGRALGNPQPPVPLAKPPA